MEKKEKEPIVITVTPEEREEMEKMARKRNTRKMLRRRYWIVLRYADGQSAPSIAKDLGVQLQSVTCWLKRFSEGGVEALKDRPRPGARRKIDEEFENRILAVLNELPPAGCSRWNGRLIAEHLGDVTTYQVLTVIRRHCIDLKKRRS